MHPGFNLGLEVPDRNVRKQRLIEGDIGFEIKKVWGGGG